MRLAPSDLFRSLLLRLLAPDDEDALGDLDEELVRRAADADRRGKPWRARVRREVWYASEAISLAMAVVRARPRRSETPWDTTEGALNALGRDMRHAARGLARDRTTTVVIGITLAVAIGATTTIVAVADAAFLRPLPYPAADRLVKIYSGSREDPEAVMQISPLDLRDLADHDAIIEDIGAWSVGESVHLTEGDEPRRLEAPRASAGLFRVLGLTAELGRFFTPDEEIPGGDDVVVLSHGFWLDAFGADSGVVGASIMLDGRSYRVVGVAPEHDMLPRDADLWRALALGPEWYVPNRWGWQFLNSVARLRAGIDPDVASAALTARLAESVPERVERGQTRVARTLYKERVGASGSGVVLLLGAVALLLLMACANIMNVILVRSERRAREFALRRALGSGGGPLVRLLTLETGILALLGGSGGILLAHLAAQTVRATELGAVEYLDTVSVNLRVAGLALLATVATSAAFGAAPIVRALRTDPQAALRDAGVRTGSSRASRRLRDGLVVTQMAIAGTLLVMVGLSSSAFADLLQRDPGFRPEGVLTATIELPADAYPGDEAAAFYRSLMGRVRSLPGVEHAGAVAFLPLSGVGWSASFALVDPDPAVTDPDPGGNMRPVAAGYFETLEIPLLTGRTFTDADDGSVPPVAIVDETLATRYWPGGSPVGRRAVIGALSREPATIVGVVGSVPDESLASLGGGHVYFPVLQRAERRMTLVLRAGEDPATIAPALRSIIRDTDPRIPVIELTTLEERMRESLAAPRAGLLLLGLFGGVAMLLAAVGVYGVLSYSVIRRTGEIGTRLALGATPATLRRIVVVQAMRLWLVGALAGGVGAAFAADLMTRYIQGIEPVDPVPYAMALLGLGGVALLAALVPATRATGVDPTQALRAE